MAAQALGLFFYRIYYMESVLRYLGNDVYLRLPGKPERKIAEIKDRWLYVKRDPNKSQIMKKFESIGLNHELLKSGKFDYIRVYYGNRVLETTSWFFEDRGLFYHHKKAGFERQRFLDVSLFLGISESLRIEREYNQRLNSIHNDINHKKQSVIIKSQNLSLFA
jgi:hypothetical protein